MKNEAGGCYFAVIFAAFIDKFKWKCGWVARLRQRAKESEKRGERKNRPKTTTRLAAQEAEKTSARKIIYLFRRDPWFSFCKFGVIVVRSVCRTLWSILHAVCPPHCVFAIHCVKCSSFYSATLRRNDL